jgi:hypothetical protein
MSLSVFLACLWAIAATITALLPYRMQFPPGILLLVAAPLLIAYLGYQHGPIWVVLALAAFASMFRKPLAYLARKALGQAPKRPGDEE